MKKVFFTILFVLCCTMGFAQLSFNVKAGLNLSSYIGDNSDHSKFKPGARIGVGMEYQFTDLVSLQPSLFFSQKGAKYSGGYHGTKTFLHHLHIITNHIICNNLFFTRTNHGKLD